MSSSEKDEVVINLEGQPIEEGNDLPGDHAAPDESQIGESTAIRSVESSSKDQPALSEGPRQEAELDRMETQPTVSADTPRSGQSEPLSPPTPSEERANLSDSSEIRYLENEQKGPDVSRPGVESTPQSVSSTMPPSFKKPSGLPPEPLKPKTPSLQIQIQIPNGMVGKSYNAVVTAGVHKSSELPRGYRSEDVIVRPLRVDGLEAIGLRDESVGQELRIVGEPSTAGDHPISVHFAVSLKGEHWISTRKALVLTINPDPRSLWKEIEPNPTAPFRRPHLRQERQQAEAVLIAASRRGRSHANKGEHRDDEFRIAHSRDKGWYALAVADGAGSAPVSRRGAELACKFSVDAIKPHLSTTFDESFHRMVEAYAAGQEESRDAIHDALYRSLGDGARGAYRAVLAEATQHGRPIEHFATTLILTIARRYPCGWFVATIAVGDGGAGAYRENGGVVVLNQPDTGEFAGQTRFLTMSKIWDDNCEVRSRIRFAVIPDLVGLVAMTDGVTDPKFPTERDLFDPDRWQAFWKELSGSVGLTKANDQAASELLDWLGFWAVGSHDDRTIAILLP